MKKILTILWITSTVLFSTLASAQCDAPANLQASYNNNVSTFTWDAVAGATSYTIEFKYPAYTWDNLEYQTTVTTNSLVLTGIIQSSNLDWRVKADCGSAVSNYTAAQFTVPCPSPTGLNTTNITATTATLNWTAAAGYNTTLSDFVVSYRVANSNASWIFLGHTFGTTFTLTGLNGGITYEWCVTQTCAYFNSTPAITQFTTTPPACATPTGLNTTNITANSATVAWSAVASAVSYNVQYKTANSNTWSTVINTNATSLLLSGLASSTIYNWRVMANCTNGTSVYTAAQFTTALCASAGNNSKEWIDLFRLGTINRISGAEAGGYVNTGLNNTLVIGSTNNSGVISGGFSGKMNNQNFAIYIDLNNNNSFNDPGERVYGPAAITKANNVSFAFNIPTTATAALTKMRVVMARNGTSINPCLTGFNGETEDYTVNLVNTNNRQSFTSADVVKVQTTLGISPNPSNGKFMIQMPKETVALAYEILNATGGMMKVQSVKQLTQFQIDISNSPRGVYLLNIKDANGKQHTAKLLLQ
jgi:hypothetical protein